MRGAMPKTGSFCTDICDITGREWCAESCATKGHAVRDAAFCGLIGIAAGGFYHSKDAVGEADEHSALAWNAVRANTPEAPALFLGDALVADYAAFHRNGRASGGDGCGRAVSSPETGWRYLPKNAPEYLIALYGIWYAGAAAVPINAKLHGREAAWIVGDAGVKLTFDLCRTGRGVAGGGDRACDVVEMQSGAYRAAFEGPAIAAVTPQDPGDLAWLFYTSGTTGKPKGVMITHRMLSSYDAGLSGGCRCGDGGSCHALCRADEPCGGACICWCM